MGHAYNPSTRQTKAEDYNLEIRVGEKALPIKVLATTDNLNLILGLK